jgi:hypothetical protein
MPQQVLHNFIVLAVGFEESCEGAPEGVPRDPLGDAKPLDHRPLFDYPDRRGRSPIKSRAQSANNIDPRLARFPEEIPYPTIAECMRFLIATIPFLL